MFVAPIKPRKKRLAEYPRLRNVLLSLHQFLRQKVLSLCQIVRTPKFITSWTGPLYQRNCYDIELDITYSCNLKCYGCNRVCGLAPSDDCLSLEQIRQFIRESKARNMPWKTIRVMGGEPTMHPHFLLIIEELLNFKAVQAPNVSIVVLSNGCGKKVNDMLARVDPDVVVMNSAKNSRAHVFQPINLAPKDSPWYRYADFSIGCWNPRDCGMCLNPYGYYPCAPAGAIDRVFGFNIGRKSLPDLSDPMRDEMATLCGYCGHFKVHWPKKLDKNYISESWRQALDNYQVSKPLMTFYRWP